MGGGEAPVVARQPPALPVARELAARTDADTIANAVQQAILHTVYTDQADDEGFIEALDRSVRENVRAIVHVFAGRIQIESVSPAGAFAFATLSAELGIPVSVLERAYWVGMAKFWSEWFALCEQEHAHTGTPLEDLVREPTQLLFAYIDHVLLSVISHYDVARTDMIRTREHLRRAVLGQILEGTVDGDPTDLERALGYPLRATHLGLCLQACDRAEVERALAVLVPAADAAASLMFQRGARRWSAWLGRPSPYGPRELFGLRRALADCGVHVAVGEPWPDLDGLRRTQEEATMAADVQEALGIGSTATLWYRDVRLEALLLSDERRARRFVIEELGPLAAEEPRLARIRETLLVWLSTGTHVAAAALLGLHENTVRNRIRQAEELLPGVTTGRRTELQVALRLERVLGAQSGRADGAVPAGGRHLDVAAPDGEASRSHAVRRAGVHTSAPHGPARRAGASR
ncbi:MAG TPA: helix-turn-helix domain-containing protein [Solirubrobacteraceae bacterium]|jgi:hypothetical protein|nr:helix-turn-helix domain-containing protein [Solirubrobacteraceae bacterium]